MGEPSRFGRRLKAFRERAKLSQTRLAALSGVDRVNISYVESGRQKSLSIENAIKICDVLGISLDELARGDRLAEEDLAAASV